METLFDRGREVLIEGVKGSSGIPDLGTEKSVGNTPFVLYNF